MYLILHLSPLFSGSVARHTYNNTESNIRTPPTGPGTDRCLRSYTPTSPPTSTARHPVRRSQPIPLIPSHPSTAPPSPSSPHPCLSPPHHHQRPQYHPLPPQSVSKHSIPFLPTPTPKSNTSSCQGSTYLEIPTSIRPPPLSLSLAAHGSRQIDFGVRLRE